MAQVVEILPHGHQGPSHLAVHTIAVENIESNKPGAPLTNMD